MQILICVLLCRHYNHKNIMIVVIGRCHTPEVLKRVLTHLSFFHSGVQKLDEIYDPIGEGEAVVVEEEVVES
jgi:hypothetical protein